MKLGLDFHGVITDDTKLFRNMALEAIQNGGEVHIITGARRRTFLKQICDLGITHFPYTHFFSISDYYIESGEVEVDLTDPDFPKMDTDAWDKTKAKYCKANSIDMMIDDSPHYGEHFETPYFLYKSHTNVDMFRYDVIKDIRKRST